MSLITKKREKTRVRRCCSAYKVNLLDNLIVALVKEVRPELDAVVMLTK